MQGKNHNQHPAVNAYEARLAKNKLDAERETVVMEADLLEKKRLRARNDNLLRKYGTPDDSAATGAPLAAAPKKLAPPGFPQAAFDLMESKMDQGIFISYKDGVEIVKSHLPKADTEDDVDYLARVATILHSYRRFFDPSPPLPSATKATPKKLAPPGFPQDAFDIMERAMDMGFFILYDNGMEIVKSHLPKLKTETDSDYETRAMTTLHLYRRMFYGTSTSGDAGAPGASGCSDGDGRAPGTTDSRPPKRRRTAASASGAFASVDAVAVDLACDD